MEMLLAAIIAILLVLLIFLGCFSWEWYPITSTSGVYIAGSEVRLKWNSLEELISILNKNVWLYMFRHINNNNDNKYIDIDTVSEKLAIAKMFISATIMIFCSSKTAFGFREQ